MNDPRYDFLGFDDPTQAVSANLTSAPPKVMLRELLTNCIEARPDKGEKVRRIEIRPVDVVEVVNGEIVGRMPAQKLSFLNSGMSMNEVEMRKAAQLSGSLNKKTGNAGKKNRGEGAKLASMIFNRLGFRMRCCHKGTLRQMKIIGVVDPNEPDELKFAVERVLVNGNWEPVITLNWETDLSDEEYDRYNNAAGGDDGNADFTEVTLLGNTPDQETWRDPYGLGPNPSYGNCAVPFELFSRFYQYPKVGGNLYPSNLKVNVVVDNSMRAASAYTLHTLNDLITNPKWSADFANLNERFADGPDGIKLEYIHNLLISEDGTRVDAAGAGGRTPYVQRSVGWDGRVAVVWEGEMYDVAEGAQWGREVINFGLRGLSKRVSVLIHLPKEYARDDRYRSKLLRTSDNTEISRRDFERLIVEKRPKWVLDLVRERPNGRNSTVEDRLQDYFDSLQATAAGGGITGEKEEVENRTRSGSDTRPEDNEDPPVAEKKKRAPRKRGKADLTDKPGDFRRRAPKIVWSNSQEVENFTKLVDAVYSDSANELTLNDESPVIDAMIKSLLTSSRNVVYPDSVTPITAAYVRDHIALKVGRAVVWAKSQKGSPTSGWGQNDYDQATSPFTLTQLVLSCEADATLLARDFKRSGDFREALSEAGITANDDEERSAAA